MVEDSLLRTRIPFVVAAGESEMSFTLAESTEWWFEIPPDLQEQYWRQSQAHTTDSRCWNAYLNQLCLSLILDWIRTEEAPEATSWLIPEAASAVWEFVNGSAIQIANQRLVLIPTEVIEDDLEIPQEWVDIPSWAGDYYLGVEVSLDAESLRVWGYATHLELKTLGSYDPDDRFYFLDAQQVSTDLTTFSVIRQRCINEQTRAAIAPVQTILESQADNLIERLSKPLVTFPRLEIPFPIWGALLAQDEWRQRLYNQRLDPSHKQPARLSKWLQESVEALESLWQNPEVFLERNYVRKSRAEQEDGVKKAKLIDLGIQLRSQSVVLLVAIAPENEERVSVCVQLHPTPEERFLPQNLKLALVSTAKDVVTEKLEQEVDSREQDNYIQLKRFKGKVGESFSVQVTFGEARVTEDFVI